MGERMRITFLAAGERERAARLWRELERRAPERPLGVRWAWTDAWLRHYGDLVPHRFALAQAHDAGGPCGIVLVAERIKRRGPIPLRRLLLGTAGEPQGETVYVQRNGVLAAPGRRAAVVGALLATLADEGGWHELELPGFDPAHAADFLARDQALVPTRAPTPTMRLEGLGGLDDVLGSLRSKARRRLRRQLRFYERLALDWPEDAAAKLELFEELRELHERRRLGQSALRSARFLAFHRDLIATAPELTQLVRVRDGARALACLYSLADRGELVGCQTGISIPADKRQSPGLVAHVLFMAAAAERGYRAYDMSPGHLEYKRRLTNGEGELVWARGVRGRARLLDPRWQHAAAV